jgi:hypothetical protein
MHLSRDVWSQARANRFPQFSRGGSSTQVGCAYLSRSQHFFDGSQQRVSCLLFAEMVEQELSRPNGRDGIGDALARNVRCGAVDRLKEARIAALRIDVRTRSESQTP